jgi:lipopolysaccharide heptosyltransferase II
VSKKFLIIQTAFTGDVILATALLESLHASFPDARIDVLVRKGNDHLFTNHPFLTRVLTWDKRREKYKGLSRLLAEIRREEYDEVINLQRFLTTGFLTAFSKAKSKTGFDKNPLSFLFTNRIDHKLRNGLHETDRNHELIRHLTSSEKARPKLYPQETDFIFIGKYIKNPFITIAPGSVWFTKTFPEYKWVELIETILIRFPGMTVYLLGSPEEKAMCERITSAVRNPSVEILAGKLSLLQSAALMSKAKMNYSNDSAPMHLCSAMNAPVTAVYCSTIPEFGFGPLSDQFKIVQTPLKLDCKPCGLHGYRECPLVHFKCAHTIVIEDLL